MNILFHQELRFTEKQSTEALSPNSRRSIMASFMTVRLCRQYVYILFNQLETIEPIQFQLVLKKFQKTNLNIYD